MGSEYRHNTLASTYLATPRRFRVLLGKAATLLLFGLLYGVTSVAAGMLVAIPFVGVNDGSFFLDQPETWRSLALGVGSIALWTMIGMGVGILIKNMLVAMLVGISFAYLIEPILSVIFFLRGWDLPLNLMPSGATNAMLGVTSPVLFAGDNPFPWWQGALVLAGWCLLPAVIGIAVHGPARCQLRRASAYAAQLEWPLIHAGKVRELYAVDDERLLMVATDKISAFDYVLDSLIPDKGVILNQLSLWWFDQLGDLVDNHVRSTAVPAAGRRTGGDLRAAGDDPGRVRRPRLPDRVGLDGVPGQSAPCAGSRCPTAWSTAPGCPSRSSPRPPRRRWASTTRTSTSPRWPPRSATTWPSRSATLTLAVYARAEGIARERGIILADTKFEFGQRPDGTIVLADEVLTPDSSRFWDAATWAAGRPTGLLRQAVRPQLAAARVGLGPGLGCRAAAAAAEIVAATRAKYVEAYEDHRVAF